MISAFLCLIHCLILPLITILPIGFTNNHWIDLFFAVLGVFAVVKIIKSNARKLIKLVLIISLAILICSVLYTLMTHKHTIILYFAGLGVIIGHLLNFFSHKH